MLVWRIQEYLVAVIVVERYGERGSEVKKPTPTLTLNTNKSLSTLCYVDQVEHLTGPEFHKHWYQPI
jgi:hypothetical protein